MKFREKATRNCQSHPFDPNRPTAARSRCDGADSRTISVLSLQLCASAMEVDVKTLELDKVCRVCLSVKKDMRPLYGEMVAEMLMDFARIQVRRRAGLESPFLFARFC